MAATVLPWLTVVASTRPASTERCVCFEIDASNSLLLFLSAAVRYPLWNICLTVPRKYSHMLHDLFTYSVIIVLPRVGTQGSHRI